MRAILSTSPCFFLLEYFLATDICDLARLLTWNYIIGIVTGCTISVIVFAAAANLLVKAAEKKSRGPVLKSGSKLPPTRVFMDDMTITAKSIVEGRWMLEDLEKLFTLARMRFKPTKSRSLSSRKEN